ncbi:hypothetical protein E3N88_13813 [Mikania micrantha]|uniref:Uncharacterized protein n=1 Tax=Mikania micrantha TaxID=192012 RepID=A0A5N6P1P6_9ASTR|nr:hypothetical protein E3N88_13813 [Mikania micrantha]
MSGIGKTSLARYVFELHSSKFDKSSFIEGINAKSNERSNGLLDLQKQFHANISKKFELHVNDAVKYTSKIEYVLARKRVLIVLDDIGSFKQLDALLGNKCLYPGSKVIITTKDASLTKGCALLKSQVHPNYKEVLLNGLYEYESLQLLCIHAFNSQNPKEGYEEVSEKLVKYCDGHPLAIQTLGRSLQNQDVAHWEDCINVLKKESNSHINATLRGKGNLIGLALDMRMLDKKKIRELETNSLSKMDNLMLLQLNYVHLNKCFKSFPDELRWLCMHGFPLKSIHLDIPMENLVVLDMSYSNIESFDMSYTNPQPPSKRQKGLIGSSTKDKRLLGSLKILDLSFCEQLHNVGGFFLLLALERLILRNCTGLIEVCESIMQCDELVHIDLSYCYKLKKLPKSLVKLKKVKTVLLDGCNSCESQIVMKNVKAIPNDLKFFMISLPGSLRILSLANNRLSNECFPVDLSCLAMLEELCLDNNPIVSMPNCVRTLPRLERLYMDECYNVISIEHPPCTLRELSIYSKGEYNPSIRKIKFDPKMAPLNLRGIYQLLSSFEIEGMVKIQSMASFEEKVLHGLSWTNLEFTKEMVFKTFTNRGRTIRCQSQVYYEFGIFSTFFMGKEIPKWINCRSKGPTLSFTIPPSPKKLRGLNFLCIMEKVSSLPLLGWHDIGIPMIKISNITKNHTWVYNHYVHRVEFDGNNHYNEDGEGFCLSWLSHWMFEPNEMKVGDHVTTTVTNKYFSPGPIILECGIGLVYDDDDGNTGEEEDVLSYYKSWNHIIGGDLSPFHTTTGEYILDHNHFCRFSNETFGSYRPFISDGTNFKAPGLWNKGVSRTYTGVLTVIFKSPQVGFEPTTNRLTADRSTTELLRNNGRFDLIEFHSRSQPMTNMSSKLPSQSRVLQYIDNINSMVIKIAPGVVVTNVSIDKGDGIEAKADMDMKKYFETIIRVRS